MNGIDPKWVFYLGILVTIETALGQGTVNLTNVVPEIWVPFIKGWCTLLAFTGNVVMTALAGYSSKVAGPLVKPAVLVAVILAGLISLLPEARAADVATKAAPIFGSAYPTTKCGFYYGLGTGGSATATDGAVVGERIVQGELDALVGYTCPFGQAGFWFVEGSVGFNNVNGSVNGLALSGPLVLIQRGGVGSPINALFNPFGNSLSLPSLPALPNGVTAGPANGYFFAGLVEQDISAQIGGGQHSKQWLIAPLLGVGMLSRLSDGVVVDTWAGWQMNSQSFCPGGGAACGKLGNGGRVGVSFKY